MEKGDKIGISVFVAVGMFFTFSIGYIGGGANERQKQLEMTESKVAVKNFVSGDPSTVDLPGGQKFVGILTPSQVAAMGYGTQTLYITAERAKDDLPSKLTIWGPGRSAHSMEPRLFIQEH